MEKTHLAKRLPSEPVNELAPYRTNDEYGGEEESGLHFPQPSSHDPDGENEP